MTDLSQLWQDEPTEPGLYYATHQFDEPERVWVSVEKNAAGHLRAYSTRFSNVPLDQLFTDWRGPITEEAIAALFKPQEAEREVCHCGMYMDEHHQGSSCTTPRAMDPPEPQSPAQPEAFQVGDVVECVASYGVGCSVRAGQQYTIASVHRDDAGNCSVSVEDVWKRPGVLAEWLPDRFRLVHRPSRQFSEAEIREALLDESNDWDADMDAHTAIHNIASRLGITLEDK